MDRIREIARLAEADNGIAPLDEATLLTLRHHPERVTSWGDDKGVALVIGSELSVIVRPDERATGVATRLLQDLPDGPLTAWSHGDHPAAASLAENLGFERTRELWVMRRPSADLPPEPEPRAGIELRTFQDGDEDELLRVNAAAFAHHPEQGGLDRDGLAARMAEPWFDPSGLIMAVDSGDDGRLLGFHWTKQHSSTEGEVYVVGVDPATQGRGVGKLVTLAGLHHLAGTGVDEIHLYVEADNGPAVLLYSGLGFTHTQADTHVQYSRA